jgi:hypothetical protein
MRPHPSTGPEYLHPPADTWGLHAALALLLQLYDQAEAGQEFPRQPAVPWSQLRALGLAEPVLTRLIAQGHVEHLPETTPQGAPPRGGDLLAGPLSQLALTAGGALYARRQVGSMRPGGETSPTPFWEAGRRGLWFWGGPVKFFRDDAVRQTHFLASFERQHWQRCIDNPFCGPERCPNPKKRLHKVIGLVNRATAQAGLRFGGTGTGDVYWEADA